jgi:hypothetical protein
LRNGGATNHYAKQSGLKYGGRSAKQRLDDELASIDDARHRFLCRLPRAWRDANAMIALNSLLHF